MDNQNHCMSIKQARLIVNAHKHNLLINSFNLTFDLVTFCGLAHREYNFRSVQRPVSLSIFWPTVFCLIKNGPFAWNTDKIKNYIVFICSPFFTKSTISNAKLLQAMQNARFPQTTWPVTRADWPVWFVTAGHRAKLICNIMGRRI